MKLKKKLIFKKIQIKKFRLKNKNQIRKKNKLKGYEKLKGQV